MVGRGDTMKKIGILSALLAAMLLGTAALTGCGPSQQLTSTDGGFVSQTGGKYQAAPMRYMPVALEDEWGALDHKKPYGMRLYTLPDMDADAWLAAEDGTVFYADGVTLPTLAEMAPTAVYVYTNDEAAVMKAEITDADVVAGLVAACAEDKGGSFSSAATLSSEYSVRFASEQYPGLYYCLRYVEYEDAYYLYDGETRTHYAIGEEIFRALYPLDETQ